MKTPCKCILAWMLAPLAIVIAIIIIAVNGIDWDDDGEPNYEDPCKLKEKSK